jgi:uncharacterized protein (DUF433 family)
MCESVFSGESAASWRHRASFLLSLAWTNWSSKILGESPLIVRVYNSTVFTTAAQVATNYCGLVRMVGGAVAGVMGAFQKARGCQMSQQLINVDPAVMMGKPVIAGTRITVELILEKLGAGETLEDLLLDYPQLSREAVQAALRYAHQVLRNDVVYPWREQVA